MYQPKSNDKMLLAVNLNNDGRFNKNHFHLHFVLLQKPKINKRMALVG